MGELIGAHLKTLAEYPPVQTAKSFDRSNLVQDFLRSQQKPAQ
jgi:arylsulfatase